jgi:hypothetical protein
MGGKEIALYLTSIAAILFAVISMGVVAFMSSSVSLNAVSPSV